MRSVSAGDSTHAGGEKSAGLRLPPPLFRLHRVQKAAGDRWRVLPDGGQQTGVQDGLRDRQTERLGSIVLRVCVPYSLIYVYCNPLGVTMRSHINFDQPRLIASLPAAPIDTEGAPSTVCRNPLLITLNVDLRWAKTRKRRQRMCAWEGEASVLSSQYWGKMNDQFV